MAYSSRIVSIILGAFYLYYYRRLPKEIKIFFYFMWLSLFIDLIGAFLQYYRINNLAFLHLYVFQEMVLLLWFLILSTSKKGLKSMLRWVMIVGVLIMIIDPLFINSLQSFNNISMVYAKLSLIIFSTISLFNLYYQDGTQKEYPGIYGGIILYASVSVMLFSFGNLLAKIEFAKQYYLWFPHILSYVAFMIMAAFDIRKVIFKKK